MTDVDTIVLAAAEGAGPAFLGRSTLLVRDVASHVSNGGQPMDALTSLPVWAQLLIAFLVAGVLIVMNVGWLVQARGWLERQKQQRAADQTRPRQDRA